MLTVVTLPDMFTMSTRNHGQIMNSSKNPKPYHHGDLRRSLLEEAALLMEEEGLESLTLRKVAQRVGVSHTAPYRHFQDKAEILCAVATIGFQDLAAAMTQALPTAGACPKSQLLELGVAYVRYSVTHPSYFRAMFREHPSPSEELQQSGQQAFQQLLGAVERGISAKAFRQDDAQSMALTAWTQVHGIATLLLDGLLRDESSVEQAFVDHADAMARALIPNLIQGLTA
jgi:AcrR family transcriptional regulator